MTISSTGPLHAWCPKCHAPAFEHILTKGGVFPDGGSYDQYVRGTCKVWITSIYGWWADPRGGSLLLPEVEDHRPRLTSHAMPGFGSSGGNSPAKEPAPSPQPAAGNRSISAYAASGGGNYLRATDISRPTWYRVTGNREEDVSGEGELKMLLDLEDASGGKAALVVNKTNARNLAAMGKVDNWDALTGRYVMLGVQQVDYQGRQVPGIRVLDVRTEVPQ